jgi:hypothetical protein
LRRPQDDAHIRVTAAHPECEDVMKNYRLAPAALLIVLGVAAGCSGDSTNDPATSKTVTASETPESTTATGKPNKSTPPGGTQSTVVLESPTVNEVDLSDACAEAVVPIRELEKQYLSGREIRDNVDNIKFVDARDAAQEACSEEEFAAFSAEELLPWLNGPTQEELDEANGTSDVKKSESSVVDGSGGVADTLPGD